MASENDNCSSDENFLDLRYLFNETSVKECSAERKDERNSQLYSHHLIKKETDNQQIFNDSIYNTLLDMFPTIDSNYIKQICSEPPFEKSDQYCNIEMFINHLLGYDIQNNQDMVLKNDKALSEALLIQDIEMMEEERKNESIINEELFAEFMKTDEEVINRQLSFLESIFPDACPEKLRKIVSENIHESEELLYELVETFLNEKNYEKRDQNYPKIKFQQQSKEYTDYFTVEKFVNEFSTPFELFENPKREETFQNAALNFLKTKHKNHNAEDIESIYAANRYNLSLADKELQHSCKNCSISNQRILEILENNLKILKEVAFIQNKTLIKDFLIEKNKKDEDDMQFFRAQKILLTCQCCYDNQIKPDRSHNCGNGLHVFCEECVIRGTRVAVSNGQCAVRCFMNCPSEIPINILREVVPKDIFDVLSRKRQEQEIFQAKLDGLVTCPYCPFQMELGPEILIFTCKNPECMKISCRLCKKRDHLPTKCEDVFDAEKARKYVEEELSNTIIRRCHRCQKPFIKDYGCNKMYCPCGATSCYICKKPNIDYNHFDHKNSCKAHQNSNLFDAEQLEIKRSVVISKIKQENPDLTVPEV